MSLPEVEILTSFVARIFRIEDVTLGEPTKGFIVRYRGQLIGEDSAAAYDQLADSVAQYNITPLFRVEQGKQAVYLAQSKPEQKPTNVNVNIILFLLTVLSVMYAGSFMSPAVELQAPLPSDLLGRALFFLNRFLSGWPYALSLMSILLAHEFGHYLMSRYRKTPATLPYFIPLPMPPLGTMGAAILMRGVPKNKRVLFDIGVAGPLAGLIVAIPVLFLGLSLSSVQTIVQSKYGISLEGNSLLYLLAKFIVFGKALPAPVEPQGFLYWVKYFFTGQPIPIGGLDVFIHPVAFAGWAGLLVTSLNLIPAGTLDGGHVVYALFGDKAGKAFPFIVGILLALGFYWNGWWLWAALLFWLGRVHAEPLDQITTLDTKRRVVAALIIVIFILVFMPVPFTIKLP